MNYLPMKDLNERVLEAWIELTSTINNDRLVPSLTYNEALVCHYVYLKDEKMTASLLCAKTGILKSQMNRILNQLEAKGSIFRHRSDTDRRDIYIEPNRDNPVFVDQHEHILKLVDKITSRLGPEKSLEVIKLFQQITNIAKEVLWYD